MRGARRGAGAAQAATLLRGWVASGLIVRRCLKARARRAAAWRAASVQSRPTSPESRACRRDLRQRAGDDRQHAAHGRARTSTPGPCELFLKLENQNPGGSIKDRVGLYLIEAAERAGELKPGGTLIEATAGNTGLGLALVAAQKGYRLLLVIPDKMSQEKIFHLKAMGAEVMMTRSDVSKGHPEYYRDVAERLARETPDSYFVNQFGNPANAAGARGDHRAGDLGADGARARCRRVRRRHRRHARRADAFLRAHRARRWRWCWPIRPARGWRSYAHDREAAGEDDAVAGGGHRRGLGAAGRRFLARQQPPTPSPMRRPSAPAASCSRREGIIAGTSTGTLLAAALRYCREQKQPKRVVTFVCDSGNKYLSKVYNDYWMLDQGFLEREHFGDLRDLIARRALPSAPR